MKRVNFLLASVLLLSLILSACGGAAPAPVVSEAADTNESDAAKADSDSDDAAASVSATALVAAIRYLRIVFLPGINAVK